MSKISAVIITKNEENMIVDCIESVSFCDEVIVVDNNSDDRTAEIAKKMNAKVVKAGLLNFAELRNLGLQKVKTSWILYIDADERIDEKLKNAIKTIIDQQEQIYDGYRLQRKNFYFGNHEWPQIEKLERLFKKKTIKEWRGELHETAVVDGDIGDIDGYLLHYTHRDLSSMLKKTIEWSNIEAGLRFKANHPPVVWWRFPRVMLTAFYESYVRQKGYKVGAVGLMESIYQSFSMFITYARLWELQQNKLNISARGGSALGEKNEK
jgi:glycosyltransferase involved in cell wall biosynthesis